MCRFYQRILLQNMQFSLAEVLCPDVQIPAEKRGKCYLQTTHFPIPKAVLSSYIPHNNRIGRSPGRFVALNCIRSMILLLLISFILKPPNIFSSSARYLYFTKYNLGLSSAWHILLIPSARGIDITNTTTIINATFVIRMMGKTISQNR